MKKKIKIIGLSLSLFSLFLVALPFFLPQETYKKWFLGKLEGTLPIQVEAEGFRLSLFPWPSLRLDEVTAHNSQGPFQNNLLAQSSQVSASVELKPLFTKKILLQLEFKNPVFHYRKHQHGTSNLQSLFTAPAFQKKKKSDWQVAITSFAMENGSVQSWTAPQTKPNYQIDHLDFSVKDLSLTGKSRIPFALVCALLADRQNASAKGFFELDADSQKLKTKHLKVTLGNITAKLDGTLDLHHRNLQLSYQTSVEELGADTLEKHFPKIFARFLEIPKEEIPQLQDLKSKGTLHWSADGFSSRSSIEAESLYYKEYPLQKISLDFDFNRSQLTIKKLTGELYGSAAAGKGYFLFKKPFQYKLDLGVDNIDLTQLAFLKKQVQGSGILRAELSGTMKEGEAVQKNLNGQGEIQISKGSLPSVKLGKEIFGHPIWKLITPLAGLDKQVLNSLQQLDGHVESFAIPFQIERGVVQIIDGKWKHPRYQMALKGNISLDQKLSGGGSFFLPADEFSKLIKVDVVRKNLTDSQGNFLLPFIIGGTFEHPSFEPDRDVLTPRFTKAVAAATAVHVKDNLQKIFKPIEKKINLKSLFGN